jgi:hypothetical protein
MRDGNKQCHSSFVAIPLALAKKKKDEYIRIIKNQGAKEEFHISLV